MIRQAVVVAVVFGGAAVLSAQSAGAQATPSFEVASIRQNHLSQREAIRAFFRTSPTGDFEAIWARLRSLVILAYDVRDNQIVDEPEWFDTLRFDIVTKAPDGLNAGHTPAMIRRLLEDRFHLSVRRENRRGPVYSLEWRDSRSRRWGPSIRSPSADCDESFAPSRRSPTDAQGAANQSGCRPIWGFGPGWIFVRRAPLSSFVTFLATETDRPIIDNTGLTGTYDIDLKWSPEPSRSPTVVGGVPESAVGPSIYTAIREQLGLRLQPINGEREVLVITRIERPTLD